MTCDQIRPLLSSYHDDVLSIEERAWVRTHLASCVACSSVLNAYEEMFAALRRTPVPVPNDLRRNVYARIAEIDSRRVGRLPFGPHMLGALRTAGGTAGLLAVLAALVATALRLSDAQFALPVAVGPAQTAQNAYVPAETTAMSSLLGAQLINSLQAQPAAVQTAMAPLKQAMDHGATVRVDGVDSHHTTASRLKIRFSLLPKAQISGPKAKIIPGELTLAFTSRTPRTSSAALFTPTPAPTIPPDSGLVYLHLSDDRPFHAGRGNARWANIEFRSFVPGSRPRALATPVSEAQMFTGVNAINGGNTIIFSAMSQDSRLGGVFQFVPGTAGSAQLFALADWYPPNHYPQHRYVQQAYATRSGRVLVSLVNTVSGTVNVMSIVSNTFKTALRQVKQIGWPISNFAVAPDQSSIAWTRHTNGDNFGDLQIATLGAQAVTRTIAPLSGRPVWSPDGNYVLYLHKTALNAPEGIWLWSRQDGATREMVLPDAAGRSSIQGISWAPDSRFFTFVRTIAGPRSYSQVWLGDTQSGVIWKSFSCQFIGAAAWVRIDALPAQAAATPLPATPAAADSPTATARPQPTAYALDDGPTHVLLSFHNAVSRREYRRAYSYLSFKDGRSVAQFENGYRDTELDEVTASYPLPALLQRRPLRQNRVGFQMTAHQRSGAATIYGGWYGVEGLLDKNGKASNWRIDTKASKLKSNAEAVVLTPAECQAQTWSSPTFPIPTATAAA